MMHGDANQKRYMSAVSIGETESHREAECEGVSYYCFLIPLGPCSSFSKALVQRYELAELHRALPFSVMADLESAALSGNLFRTRSTAPSRTALTPSPKHTSDDLASDLSPQSSTTTAPSRDGYQTGPKGVIEDRRAHDRQSKIDRERGIRELASSQEKRKIIALTSVEEDEERERERFLKEAVAYEVEEVEARARWRRTRIEELKRDKEVENGDGRGLKRGGLRELGKEGFVVAVERPGWVVILIYEPVRLRPLCCNPADGDRTSRDVKTSSHPSSTFPSPCLLPHRMS